jgi:hypothetical protein
MLKKTTKINGLMNFQESGWIEHDHIGDQIEHSLQHQKRTDKKLKAKKIHPFDFPEKV